MTQTQIDDAVADALGETLHTVHRIGFSVVPEKPADLEPEDLALCIECPFCRKTRPFPGPTRGGDVPLGECPDCDVYFDIEPGDVFAAVLPTIRSRGRGAGCPARA